MRKTGDVSKILNGPVTLVLVLTFGAAAGTQALGLHPLLGAFTVGVLLSQAPRANQQLSTGVQSLTFGLFGPIFFAIAGMRVDIFKLGNPSSLSLIAGLFLAATVTKVIFPMLASRVAGRDWLQSTLVGVGLNLKGGTDVVVAVVGTELGLLSIRVYSMYTIVAVLTVLVSPPLMSFLEKRVAVGPEEQERLEKEEAEKRSYVPDIERVMVPVYDPLMPSLAAGVVEMIAQSKHRHEQIFDITRFDVGPDGDDREYETAVVAKERLEEAGTVQEVEVVRRKMPHNDILESILKQSRNYDLLAIGAKPPDPHDTVSLGDLQDAIIDQAESDVLVSIAQGVGDFSPDKLRCVLVPVNGTDHSMATADLAASLVESQRGEVVLFHVVPKEAKHLPAGAEQLESLVQRSQGFMNDLEFRLSRLEVQVTQKITVADDAAAEIIRELEKGYDLAAIGGVDRGRDGQPYMGQTIRSVVCRSKIPLVLFARHAENGKKDEGLAI